MAYYRAYYILLLRNGRLTIGKKTHYRYPVGKLNHYVCNRILCEFVYMWQYLGKDKDIMQTFFHGISYNPNCIQIYEVQALTGLMSNRTSSIYLFVKLKNLARRFFCLSLKKFCVNCASYYEYKK